MENLSASEEGAFLAEDVNNIIKESIDSVLLNTSYVHTEVGKWTSEVVEGCLKRLTGLNKPFKYVGTHEERESVCVFVCVQVHRTLYGSTHMSSYCASSDEESEKHMTRR